MFNIGDEVMVLSSMNARRNGQTFVIARIERKFDGRRDVLRDETDWGIYEDAVELVSNPSSFKFDV